MQTYAKKRVTRLHGLQDLKIRVFMCNQVQAHPITPVTSRGLSLWCLLHSLPPMQTLIKAWLHRLQTFMASSWGRPLTLAGYLRRENGNGNKCRQIGHSSKSRKHLVLAGIDALGTMKTNADLHKGVVLALA